MGFSRPELDEDSIQWNRIQAQLESAEDHDPEEPLLIDGLAAAAKSDEDDEEREGEEETIAAPSGEGMRRAPPPRLTRAPAAPPAAPRRPLPKLASPQVAAERLPMLRAAAERVKRLKKVAIDPDKTHRKGKLLFDPGAQKFGSVVFSAPGYVRLQMRDGTQSTVGKPPLGDRKQFILANFDRMDNKSMAEILAISVHTMRRLCHEYGLKRHGQEKDVERRKSA
jgi:hypothetical protein